MHEVLPASPIHSLSHAELIACGLTYQPDTFTPISVGLIACSLTYQPNAFPPPLKKVPFFCNIDLHKYIYKKRNFLNVRTFY